MQENCKNKPELFPKKLEAIICYNLISRDFLFVGLCYTAINEDSLFYPEFGGDSVADYRGFLCPPRAGSQGSQNRPPGCRNGSPPSA